MDYETGDIIIFSAVPGHVMMAYSSDELIHAQRTRGFHKVPVAQDVKGIIGYSDFDGAFRYRPDWTKVSDPGKSKQALQQIADNIMTNSTYGVYRAVRLGLGSNIFGPNAQKRLAKYVERKNNGPTDGKLVTTITCVEAAVLCYQLVFADGDPLFIRLDAAHTMPSTLGKWLENHGWSKVSTELPKAKK